MAYWKYFLIGLGIGILGAILWIIASVIGAALAIPTGETPRIVWAFMCIGWFAMVGGPLTFWIILPIRRAIKKRRSRSTGGGVV